MTKSPKPASPVTTAKSKATKSAAKAVDNSKFGKIVLESTSAPIDTGIPAHITTPELDSLPTDQQRLFCRAYVATCFNGTKAAQTAGYSVKTAYAKATALLIQPAIKTAVDSLLRVIAIRMERRTDDVLAELEWMGFSNMLDYLTIDQYGSPRVDLSNVTRAQGAAISKITSEVIERREDSIDAKTGEVVMGYTVRKTTIQLHNKDRALELLGRHHRMWGQVDLRQPDRLAELIAAMRAPAAGHIGSGPPTPPVNRQLGAGIIINAGPEGGGNGNGNIQ